MKTIMLILLFPTIAFSTPMSCNVECFTERVSYDIFLEGENTTYYEETNLVFHGGGGAKPPVRCIESELYDSYYGTDIGFEKGYHIDANGAMRDSNNMHIDPCTGIDREKNHGWWEEFTTIYSTSTSWSVHRQGETEISYCEPIPEPSTLLLFGIGSFLLVGVKNEKDMD